jgi:hypothetical protein
MNGIVSNCSDGGRLKINSDYANKRTQGDIVIFLGIVPSFAKKSKLAHSSSCYQGKFN